MPNKPSKLSEVVRHSIETCGITRYAISKESGIAQSVLSRFLSGERGLSLAALDVLMPYLGIEIQTTKPTHRAARKTARDGR